MAIAVWNASSARRIAWLTHHQDITAIAVELSIEAAAPYP
jgi:hypothetical protein